MDRAQRRTAAVLAVAIVLVLAGAIAVLLSDAQNQVADIPEPSVSDVATTDGPLFADEFVDAESGWDTLDEADLGAAGYEAGAYRVTVVAPATALNIRAPYATPTGTDGVTIEVSSLDVRGGGDQRQGVFCRGGDSGAQKYQFLFDAGGGYRIVREQDRESVVLDEGNSGETLDSTVPHRIRVDCTGGADGSPTQLRLAVDGRVLSEVTDDEGLTSTGRGFIGLSVESGGLPDGTDVAFDNMVVSALPTAEGLPEVAEASAESPTLPTETFTTDFADTASNLPTDVQETPDGRSAKGSYLGDQVYSIASGDNGFYTALLPETAVEGDPEWLVLETTYAHEGTAVDYGAVCRQNDAAEGGFLVGTSQQGLYNFESLAGEEPRTIAAGALPAPLPPTGELRIECIKGTETLPSVLRLAVNDVLVRRVPLPEEAGAAAAGSRFGLFARFNEPNEVRFEDLQVLSR